MQYDVEHINTALAYVLTITKKTCTEPRSEQASNVLGLTTEVGAVCACANWWQISVCVCVCVCECEY